MSSEGRIASVSKLATGIPGFDLISDGGLPKHRTTLVSGTAGSAKTVFAAQFLAAGIREANESGVFVTFEEPADDLRANLRSFGWDVEAWEREGRWAFVDASPRLDQEDVTSGSYDFGGLSARIGHAIERVKASRVSLDSLGAVFSQFADAATVRRELQRMSWSLKNYEVTAVMTAERTEEYGDIARFGVEEFVADNVIVLRNVLEAEKRRRTIEILKYRGTVHQKGEYPFAVMPNSGIVVIPLSAINLEQRSTDRRISSGDTELDAMCGGGLFQDSVVLVSGATGTGKTLLATEFLGRGAQRGERSLLLAFEESRDQLFRNAAGWGLDFAALEKQGVLRVECAYPETAGPEDHLIRMKDIITSFQPTRVAVDSLSALERVSTARGFREMIVTLTSFLKQHEIAAMLTAATPSLLGGESATESHISTITDTIVLLRYVEMFGEMRRGITVLKMRGSKHDKDIREFTIDQEGMHIGRPFRNVTGILSGNPVHVVPVEIDRVDHLFQHGDRKEPR